ncbi:MAG: TIGR02996 domain-containing protein [Planctomycetales bacterium]|nr:TIGR02996 domain-containing protein [Planctomycetales bacterium]
MSTDLLFLVYQHRDKDFAALIEELWSYRQMADFPRQTKHLVGYAASPYDGDNWYTPLDEALAKRVARVLNDEAEKIRMDCPCCRQVTKSRYVQHWDEDSLTSVLGFLCEQCGNVIRMRLVADSTLQRQNDSQGELEVTLQARPARPLQPPMLEPIDNLIPQLSVRIGQILLGGFDMDLASCSVDDICQISAEEFLAQRNSGPVPLNELREKLAKVGRCLRGDEDPLLHAIYSAPDDDEPRLAYAARLDRYNPPRAEFIRVQIELTRLKESDECYPELKKWESDLLEFYGWQWLGGLHDIYELGGTVFHRGFLAEAQVDPGSHRPDFVAMVLAKFPTIHKLRFDCNSQKSRDHVAFADAPKDHYPKILGQAWLRQISDLSLFGTCIEDNVAMAIAESEHAVNLRRLNVGYNNIGNAGADALANSPYLNDLQELNLEQNPIDGASASRLLERFGDRVRLQFGRHPTLSKRWEMEHGHEPEN